jgi:hypothetical protein
MARRYARDNRGRFASSGSGATARGGRLRTAAGNKRKTQTAIIRSAESKQAGKDLLKASQKSFKVNAPTKFGGENQGYATPRGKAAEQGRVAAFRNLRAAQRKSGLPASGGAMRVKGGIKRDPNVAAKLASRAKPARKTAKPVATTTKLGSRLNPAKKADRAATRKFEQAYERENRIRSSLFRGNKSLQTRQAIISELNKASNLTATMQMQRRGIRAQFPVQTKDKALSVAGSRRSGTISRNKDVRNTVNRREAFKRKVNRAGALSRPGNDRKAQRTAQVRAKAMATYQGARRPEISDSTVGRFGKSRTSTAFRAPASRLASPSRAARQQGRALAIAQKPIRDQFGRRIGNPKKQQRSQKTGARAMKFYQNPKATAQSVLRDRGSRGLSTKGFRRPRGMR